MSKYITYSHSNKWTKTQTMWMLQSSQPHMFKVTTFSYRTKRYDWVSLFARILIIAALFSKLLLLSYSNQANENIFAKRTTLGFNLRINFTEFRLSLMKNKTQLGNICSTRNFNHDKYASKKTLWKLSILSQIDRSQ